MRRLWQRALSPEKGFRSLAAEAPGLVPSLGRLMAWRAPVALLELLLTYWGLGRMYKGLLDLEGPLWSLVLQQVAPEAGIEDVRFLLQELPPLPALQRVLPWLLLAAPLYVISLWIHDAVWDHGCLWMLGGLKSKRGFNTTLIAESEALQVGVFGAVLGLSTSLPGVGWLLSLPVGLVGAYFWVLRGVAMAAFHGCATWKGIVATVLHAALAVCCVVGTLLAVFLLLAQGLA